MVKPDRTFGFGLCVFAGQQVKHRSASALTGSFLNMVEFAALTYGLLASVILSAAQRNRKMARPHPPMLLYVGYLVCGLSTGLALALAYAAYSLFAGI